jgi:hypothetical protein
MFKNLSNRVLKAENRRINLIFFSLLAITIIGFQRAGAYISEASGLQTKPLDLEFYFTAERAYELIATYNQAVRSFYIPFELSADIIYPILYGIYLSLILSFLLKKNWQDPHNQVISLVNLLPFGASIFDFFENFGIVILVANYDTRLDTLAVITGINNAIKWIFAGLTLLSILVLAVRWLLKKIINF